MGQTQTIQERLRTAEAQVYDQSGIAPENITRNFITVTAGGEQFNVNTVIVESEGGGSTQTLLLTHGFASSCAQFAPAVALLRNHYRVVMFDNLCFGSNSRLESPWPERSSEEAISFLVEFWTEVIDSLTRSGDLPERFMLAGHSFGGYQASLWASNNPDRVEKLMLLSPAFFEVYDEENYDPYIYRNDFFQQGPGLPPSKAQVDKLMRQMRQRVHPSQQFRSYPEWIFRWAVRRKNAQAMPGCRAELVKAIADYAALCIQHFSPIDLIVYDLSVYFNLGKQSITDKFHLGNPACDFPIAAVYGTSDFNGSEGVELLIKGSKHYDSGDSQIFLIDNAGHNMMLNNPTALAECMIGFFSGAVKGRFETKKMSDFTPIDPEYMNPQPKISMIEKPKNVV